MKLRHITVMIVLLAGMAGTAFAGGEGWMTDFEAAKAKAAKEGKFLLVDFTGSDWCGWCIKLNKEVFSQDFFKHEAPNNFILVELDYPRDKSKLTEEQIKQNNKLRDEYQIRGYPTILLMDTKGNVFAKTGYKAGGPEKYIDHLNKLVESEKKFQEALANANKAEGAEKAKLLDQALESKGREAIEMYPDVVDQIIKLDADNKLGLKKKYAGRRAMQKLQQSLRTTPPDQLVAKIDQVIKENELTGEVLQEALFYKGIAYLQTGNLDTGLDTMQKAHDTAPESQQAARITMLIDRIKKQIEAAKQKQQEQQNKEQN